MYNILAKKANRELYLKCQKYFRTYNNKDLIDYGVFEAKGNNEIERCAQVK